MSRALTDVADEHDCESIYRLIIDNAGPTNEQHLRGWFGARLDASELRHPRAVSPPGRILEQSTHQGPG